MIYNDAIQKLQKQVEYIVILKGLGIDSPQFKEWHRDTAVVIEKIFAGDNARHKNEFEEFYRPLVVALASNDDNAKHRAYRNYLNLVEPCLKSMVKEIEAQHSTVRSWRMVIKYAIAIIALFVGGGTLTWHFVWNKTTNINTPQAKSGGKYSPANLTTGPNSPVTNIYNFSGEEKNSRQTTANKLQMTLKAVFDDIDSRPLVQQEETTKKYIDMKLKIVKERFKIKDVEIDNDPNLYLVALVFPDELEPPKWVILCTVPKNTYPQLGIARKGNEIYVSGELKGTFRSFSGQACVELSKTTLEFE